MPQLQDFQFFNIRRLTELFEKENAYEIHKHVLVAKKANLEQQVRSCGESVMRGMQIAHQHNHCSKANSRTG
jgi:hypothetical protein